MASLGRECILPAPRVQPLATLRRLGLERCCLTRHGRVTRDKSGGHQAVRKVSRMAGHEPGLGRRYPAPAGHAGDVFRLGTRAAAMAADASRTAMPKMNARWVPLPAGGWPRQLRSGGWPPGHRGARHGFFEPSPQVTSPGARAAWYWGDLTRSSWRSPIRTERAVEMQRTVERPPLAWAIFASVYS